MAVAILSLFNIKTGIALILSYLTTLLLLFISRKIDLKKVFFSMATLGAAIMVFLLIINLLFLLFGYQLIDIFAATTRLRQFAIAGVNMLPIPEKGYFWAVVLIYFASVIYLFEKRCTRQP